MRIEKGYSRLRIPVGPVHPAIAESPVKFMLDVEGEVVVRVDFEIGYSHRGIEYLSQRRRWDQITYLVERICGICSHSHPFAYVQAVENMLGIEVPDRAKYIRTIIGELERIQSHLLWAGIAAEEIGYETLFMYAWRDREIVNELLELLTGNRVNYAMHRIGGVRRNIRESSIGVAREKLRKLAEANEKLKRIFLKDTRIAERGLGVAALSREDAIKLGAVGPNARSSNVDEDIRRDDPHAAYPYIDWDVITYKRAREIAECNEGDVISQVLVRLLEIDESIKIVEQALKDLPKGLMFTPWRMEEGEGIGRYEAPRGEVFHYVRSDGSDHPIRHKIRAPTLANIPTYIPKLMGVQVADIPIAIASIDPCLCCTDRMCTVTLNGKMVEWDKIRELCRRKYR